MIIENNLLKNLFRNVYFVNGTAYAGKSTMVRLLAEKYDGICCGENYHDALMDLIDSSHQPALSYFDTMSGWQEFISRTPEEYDAWFVNVGKEAAQLEVLMLIQLAQTGRKIFVDTNIGVDILKEISDFHHVAIMLSPQWTSVNQFFDRPDPEKQFLYQKLLEAPDPESAIVNFRKCLEKINSQEHFDALANSGFYVQHRDDHRTVEESLSLLEQHFKLK